MFLEQEEHLIDSMYHCCREESKRNNSKTSQTSISQKRFANEKLGREEKFARTETKKSGSQRNARSIEEGGGKERFTISRN